MFSYYPKEKVFSFEKSANEEVQGAISERKGKVFLDLRVYHIQEDGSKIGTHKGIFFSVDKLPELKAGIEKLIEATRNRV